MGIGIGESHGTRLLEHEDSPSQLAWEWSARERERIIEDGGDEIDRRF